MSFSQGASEFEDKLKRVGQDGGVPRLTRLVQDPQGRFCPSPSATTASSSRGSKRGRDEDDAIESFPTQRVKRPMYRGTFASRTSDLLESDRMDFEYTRPPSSPRVRDTEQLHIEETRQSAEPSGGRRKDNSYEGTRKQSPDHLPDTSDAGKIVRGEVSEGCTDDDGTHDAGGVEGGGLADMIKSLSLRTEDRELTEFGGQFAQGVVSLDQEIEFELL
jgi:hypothetical protein